MTAEPIPRDADDIARQVVDAAFEVHTSLGPGLLEGVYERCLSRELKLRGLRPQNQVHVDIKYKGEEIESGFRADVIVNDFVIVEIKAVDASVPVNRAQVLTYLKLTGLRLGLLINFNVALIKDGIKRIVR